jgi:hypothetical protein
MILYTEIQNTFIIMPRKTILFIFVIITLCIGMPLFSRMNALGVQDWDYSAGHELLAQTSYLKYGQLPLWNPYYCGGMSNIGNSTTDFLSPFFLPILFLGPIIGGKIVFLIFIFIGFIGFYLLGSILKISGVSRVLMGITYMASGLFIIPFAGGMTLFLSVALLPYLLFFFVQAINGSKSSILGVSVCLSMIFFWGFHYIAIVLLFILILGGVWSLISLRKKPLIISILSIVLFFCLSAVKIVPSLETNKNHQRVLYEPQSGYSIESLSYSLLSRNQTFEKFYEISDYGLSFWKNRSYTYAENGMYVGFVVCAFFIVGFFIRGKKFLPLTITFLILLWLMFGYTLTPSLYKITQYFPIFQYMRVAQRYRYCAMVLFSIFVGFGFDIFLTNINKAIKNKRITYVLGIIIVTGIFLDMVIVNSPILSKTYIIPPRGITPGNDFTQVCNNGLYYTATGFIDSIETYGAWYNVFPYIQENYGVSDHCGEPLTIPTATICKDTENYQGESYLEKATGTVTNTYWSPNRLLYTVHTTSENQLIINQNYDAGWHAIINGTIKQKPNSHLGLLSVPITESATVIELYYLPNSFIFGAVISSVTIVTLIVYMVFKNIHHRS